MIHGLKWFKDPGGCEHAGFICIVQHRQHTGRRRFPPTHRGLRRPLTHVASQMLAGYLFCTHQILGGLLLHRLSPCGTGLTWEGVKHFPLRSSFQSAAEAKSFCTSILFTDKTASLWQGNEPESKSEWGIMGQIEGYLSSVTLESFITCEPGS